MKFLRSIVIGAAALAVLEGCPGQPFTACQNGMSSEQCFVFCSQWTTCSECAAYPVCGWCDPTGSGGECGRCVPAVREIAHGERPASTCPAPAAWFYQPSDLSIPVSTPGYCPPPRPTPTTGGGESVTTAESTSGGAS